MIFNTLNFVFFVGIKKYTAIMPIRIYNIESPRESILLIGQNYEYLKTEKLLGSCDKIFQGWLDPHKGCYFPIEKIRDFATERNLPLMKAVKIFFKEKPEELEKRKTSLMEWDRKNERLFRIVYGIAARHRVYIRWHGFTAKNNPVVGISTNGLLFAHYLF